MDHHKLKFTETAVKIDLKTVINIENASAYKTN